MSYSLFADGVDKRNVAQIIAGAKGIDRNASHEGLNIAFNLHYIISDSNISLNDFKLIIRALPKHWLNEDLLKKLVVKADSEYILNDKCFKLAFAIQYTFEDVLIEQTSDKLKITALGSLERNLRNITTYDKNVLGMIVGQEGFFNSQKTLYHLFLDDMGNLGNNIASLMSSYEGDVWRQKQNCKFNRLMLGTFVFSTLGAWAIDEYKPFVINSTLLATAVMSITSYVINHFDAEFFSYSLPHFKNTAVDLYDKTTNFVDYVTQQASSCTRRIA